MSSSEKFHTFYQDLPMELYEKLKKIKIVVFDVDGSLTDCSIILDRETNEFKRFNGQDGMGINMLLRAGIEVAIITGRTSPLTERRAKELRIPHVLQGHMQKEAALLGLLKDLNLSTDELCVLGDDFTDLDLYKHAYISACPADGYHYMKKIATVVLTKNGGRGAAREICDYILMANGKVGPDGEPYMLLDGSTKLMPSVQ